MNVQILGGWLFALQNVLLGTMSRNILHDSPERKLKRWNFYRIVLKMTEVKDDRFAVND
jgi:hypothetical protein